MSVTVDFTPNPNALKFTIGRPVGGPITLTPGTDHPLGRALLEIEGVGSVFMTGDFVTVSKSPDANWEQITPRVLSALEAHFKE